MKRYVLYGTGLEGERFLYRHAYMKDDIEYCIDAFHTGNFHGLPIVTLDNAVNLAEYKIIVAAVSQTYLKIKGILEKKGLTEFENFIWASVIGRKVVLTNANCHGDAIILYLMRSSDFKEKYVVYPLPPIHLNEKRRIEDHILKHTDVYIHQDIRSDNKIGYELSDEYIVPRLKKGCKSVTIPNFVGLAQWMFPMQGELEKVISTPSDQIAVLFKDSILEKACDEGLKTLDDYKHYYHNFRFEDSLLREKFKNEMGKIRERNKNWDIKIADYIADNYQTVPLFVDRNHPSKYLMREIGRQTADILGIHDIERESKYEPRLGIPAPILQCVQECFQMNFLLPCEEMRCKLETKSAFGLKDYIRCYMWWYHDVSLT